MKWIFFVLVAVFAARGETLIHHTLKESFKTQATANVIVKMKEGTHTALETYVKPHSRNRGDKIRAMKGALELQAKSSQEIILQSLNQFFTTSIEYHPLWISNEIYIRGATLEVVEHLQSVANAAEIYQEHIIPLETFDLQRVDYDGMKNTSEWGIDEIRIPSVWDMGLTGKGIRIGSIDTGVDVTHEALVDNYVGKDSSGWYDPNNEENTMPTDEEGHGTHTVGTMVGKGGIGVAPDAKWMACNACNRRGCSEYLLKLCGQFMVCPHDIYGENEDCSLAPHLVSNSWAGGKGNPFYDEVIEAWREADIIPVFALGNFGTLGCGSASSPGDNPNVIAVGATTNTNEIASFSSVGPPILDHTLIKPDIVAPGKDIRSAWISSTSSYMTISGTSMACPHVSGVIALILQEYPQADYGTIYDILTRNTNHELIPSARSCGDLDSSSFPNFIAGYGLIDGRKCCNAAALAHEV